jgi:hypothetical protein
MRRAIPLLASLLALAGCSDDEGSSGSGSGPCDNASVSPQTYSVGLAATGDLARVKLLDAQPAPPGRGQNAWTVQLLDTADAPAPDIAITRVKPFMPDHGHGSSAPPTVGELDAEARAEITAIDFMMPGVWTITFELDVAGTADRAVFAFCIDG